MAGLGAHWVPGWDGPLGYKLRSGLQLEGALGWNCQPCHSPVKERLAVERTIYNPVHPCFLLQPKELDPSAVLPLDCLLAFVFFDANWCGYLHRRDLERILLTLGLRLSAEQVPSLAPLGPF